MPHYEDYAPVVSLEEIPAVLTQDYLEKLLFSLHRLPDGRPVLREKVNEPDQSGDYEGRETNIVFPNDELALAYCIGAQSYAGWSA